MYLWHEQSHCGDALMNAVVERESWQYQVLWWKEGDWKGVKWEGGHEGARVGRVQDMWGERAIWKEMIEKDGWEEMRQRKGDDLELASEKERESRNGGKRAKEQATGIV